MRMRCGFLHSSMDNFPDLCNAVNKLYGYHKVIATPIQNNRAYRTQHRRFTKRRRRSSGLARRLPCFEDSCNEAPKYYKLHEYQAEFYFSSCIYYVKTLRKAEQNRAGGGSIFVPSIPVFWASINGEKGWMWFSSKIPTRTRCTAQDCHCAGVWSPLNDLFVIKSHSNGRKFRWL